MNKTTRIIITIGGGILGSILIVLAAIFTFMPSVNKKIDLEKILFFYATGVEGHVNIMAYPNIGNAQSSYSQMQEITEIINDLEFEVTSDKLDQPILLTKKTVLDLKNGDVVTLRLVNTAVLTQRKLKLKKDTFQYTISTLGREVEAMDLTSEVLDEFLDDSVHQILGGEEFASVDDIFLLGTPQNLYYKIEEFDDRSTFDDTDSAKKTYNLTIVESYLYEGKVYLFGATGMYLVEYASLDYKYLANVDSFTDSILGINATNRTPETVEKILADLGFQKLEYDVSAKPLLT